MSEHAAGANLPLGGAGLGLDDYIEFLAVEYLDDYVRRGGGTVRFVVPGSDEVAHRWHRRLAAAAESAGYHYAPVDAASARVHLMDQLYAEVGRSLDWARLARQMLRSAYSALGLAPVGSSGLTVAEVAGHHQVDQRELVRSVRRQLESTLLADARLAREFRLAVLRLAQAELGTGEVAEVERDAVLAWLRVEPVPLRALRSSLIFSRVGRHNARAMLVSLARWLAGLGSPGLVIDLDLNRLSVTRRPPAEARTGTYYTRAAAFDAYEVLRQLVDATDTLEHVLVAVALPPELLTDDRRGLPAYSPLHLRVVDEVRDRRRANPYAALVRLETRMEAVP